MWAVVSALVILAAAEPSRADARDPAAAEALFEEGRRAMDAKRFSEACDKFAESQRLDPAAGTLVNLAACRERTGELALAWEAWRQALQLLPSDDKRRPEVARRVATAEARVPRLAIRLAPAAPGNSSIRRDGIEVGPAARGSFIPVNPGEHEIVVEAPGRAERRYRVQLAEAERKTLEVEPGDPSASAETRSAPPPPPPSIRVERHPAPPSRTADTGRTARTVGYVLGGVGLTGLVVGGVSGALALGKKNDMDAQCAERQGELRCSDAGLDAARSGNRWANVSTVSFAVGALALGAGAYLVLTNGPPERSSVGVVMGTRGREASLGFAGRF